MSKPHLHALESALARRGWRVVVVHTGNDYNIAAAWEIQRSTGQRSLFIDFDGMGLDGNVCLPIEESYGCKLRSHPSIDLYFRRVNKSRELWERDVEEFVRALDNEAIKNL